MAQYRLLGRNDVIMPGDWQKPFRERRNVANETR